MAVIQNDQVRIFDCPSEGSCTTYVPFVSTRSIEKIARALVLTERVSGMTYDVIDLTEMAHRVTYHLGKVADGYEKDISPGTPPAGPLGPMTDLGTGGC